MIRDECRRERRRCLADDQLSDGSEMHTGERVGEAWRTKQNQLPVVSEMQAGERACEAWRTEHNQLAVVSEIQAGEEGRRGGRKWKVLEGLLVVMDACTCSNVGPRSRGCRNVGEVGVVGWLRVCWCSASE